MKLNILLAIVGTSGLAIAQTLPMEDWEKHGVSGACIALLAWVITRTIPQMHKDNSEAMKHLGDKFDGFTNTVVELLRDRK